MVPVGKVLSQFLAVFLVTFIAGLGPDAESLVHDRAYRGCLIQLGKQGYFAGKIDLSEKLYINNPCDVTLTGEKQSYRPPISIGKIRSLYIDPHWLVIIGRRATIKAFKKTCVEIVEDASQADAILNFNSKERQYDGNSGGYLDCFSGPNSASCSDGVTRNVMTCSGAQCESHTEAVTDDWLDLLDGHSYEPLKDGWKRDYYFTEKPQAIAAAISIAVGCQN